MDLFETDLADFHNSIEDLDQLAAAMDAEDEAADMALIAELEDFADGQFVMSCSALGL